LTFHTASRRSQSPVSPHNPSRLQWLDPGWLFLLAGGAILVATILIPASERTHDAQRQVEQARILAAHQSERLARYSAYLDALDRRDRTLITSLAATQLNLTPMGMRVALAGDPETFATAPIDVFGSIEPTLAPMPNNYTPVNSILGRLARGERSRLVLLAAAAMSILLGLLPPTRTNRG